MVTKFTVLFESPFWVGIYERVENGRYEACKIIFGAEPKDSEVYSFLLKNPCFKFSPPVESAKKPETRVNPKRMQRLIHKEAGSTEIGTKAQQALKLLQERNKAARKTVLKEKREAEKEKQFTFKQNKRKEKHRGH